MDSARAEHPSDIDPSALAWVLEEMRRSLELAHKGLRRFVKEYQTVFDSDVDAVDPAVLRGVRQQLHQSVGALELVGLPAAAKVLRASEAIIQRFVAKPKRISEEVADAIEAASFALLDYLGRKLAGKHVSALAMFPQYRALQEAAGVERVHPSDLWTHEWRWLDLPADPTAHPLATDAQTRLALEEQLLALMRSSVTAARQRASFGRIADLCSGLGAGAAEAHAATLWKLAAAMFEAQQHGLLKPDLFTKRVASRLLPQFRQLDAGSGEVSERLAHELLFFCAQADSPGAGHDAPRLAAVRQAYGLAHHVPADYNVSLLGRFDPALIVQARKRVAAAKEAWGSVAGGEVHRLGSINEQFVLVGDSLRRLVADGKLLADELQTTVAEVQHVSAPPPAALAMEVATSLLYLDAALEDGEFDEPRQAERVRRMAERISAVRAGQAPQPLESWMEDLYRRVSDRQTLGSVVHELRASLSESEQLIDKYFRNPGDNQPLMPVPAQLSAMRGVLSVLGLEQASQAVLRMRDDVDALLTTEVDPERAAQTGTFERLASNLGALGFLIDMFSVQPALAKSLFAFDAERGTLEALMGRTPAEVVLGEPAPAPMQPRLIEQAQSLAFSSARPDVAVADLTRELERFSAEARDVAPDSVLAAVETAQAAFQAAHDDAELAAAREQLSEALVDFVHTSSSPMPLEPLESPPPRPLPDALAQDDEMREIFLEEAREVLAAARAALAALGDDPAGLEHLTGLRRAFHTLKGSARMVGLQEFGAAAWAGEQVYNTRLAEQRPADGPLLAFTAAALAELDPWIDAIAQGASLERFAAAHVEAAAGALSTPAGADLAPLAEVAPQESDGTAATAAEAPILPPGLPQAEDLDFSLGLHDEPVAVESTEPLEPLEAVAVPVPAATGADEPLEFALDLRSLDGDDQAPAAATAPAFDMFATQPFPRGGVEPPVPAQAEPAGPDWAVRPKEGETESESVAAPGIEVQAQEVEGDSEGQTPVVRGATSGEPSLPEVTDEPPAYTVRGEDETEKRVGDLRIPIPLFNIYLNEADELSRRLGVELAEWAMELQRPVGEEAAALAHSLAGSSATVGFADLSQLARALEHALLHAQGRSHGDTDEAALYVEVSDEIRQLLHQFAAGFLKAPRAGLLERLATTAVEVDLRHQAEEAAVAQRTTPTAPAADAVEPEPAVAIVDDASPPEPVAVPEAAIEAMPDVPVEPPVVAEAGAPDALAVEPAASAEVASTVAPGMDGAAALALAHAVVDLEAGESHSGMGALDAAESLHAGLGQAELKPLAELAPPEPGAGLPAREAIDGADDGDEGIEAIDAVDAELFPIFEEEGQELLPLLSAQLRDWLRRPTDESAPAAAMRTLHTLKGGARLAGAMRLGEMCHRLESRIERLLAHAPVEVEDLEALQSRGDALMAAFESLRTRDAQAYAAATEAALQAVQQSAAGEAAAAREGVADSEPAFAAQAEPEPEDEPEAAAQAQAFDASTPVEARSEVEAEPQPAPAVDPPEMDWARFGTEPAVVPSAAERAGHAPLAVSQAVRVRAPLLDRMVNQAGEVSIARTRIESEIGLIRSSLADLTENLDRLRQQLRELELQGETQMSSRLEAAKAAAESFDPLEFDRFTRFQELTRMMAESVNDVATVQRTLQRAVESTEDELAAQTRLTRELQDDLLRTRMVEFESQADRLYRVVRQAAKETGKQVRLDIVGGAIELDRGVLDRMTASFEHLLRNCVTHGIESAETRVAAGKDPVGSIVVALQHERNEVAVEFRDDGGGLDLARIRDKGRALGLIAADAKPSDAELANLIFHPGFSTATTVTELAGRGIGMDVVRSDVAAMGGRIETATAAGKGTSFKLVLPLTTAVTQVVMLRCGELRVAVPASLVEVVQRATPEQVDRAYASGSFMLGDHALPFFWLGALLQHSPRGTDGGRMRSVVVIRSAQQRIALHVDEVLGNQEAVIKNLGPQLSALPGLVGMTLLASGAVALIYNPVALATLYGDVAQSLMRSAAGAMAELPVTPAPAEAAAPLVLVVDDSLTVRRVTQRLLVREGYRVTLAKDGLEALERLAEEKPQVVLSDIEMPRMDGFDLVRNLRADPRLADLPVIMITSRIAQKHREVAAELGVDHYLGKPYSEEDLLALVGRYAASAAAVMAAGVPA